MMEIEGVAHTTLNAAAGDKNPNNTAIINDMIRKTIWPPKLRLLREIHDNGLMRDNAIIANIGGAKTINNIILFSIKRDSFCTPTGNRTRIYSLGESYSIH